MIATFHMMGGKTFSTKVDRPHSLNQMLNEWQRTGILHRTEHIDGKPDYRQVYYPYHALLRVETHDD